MKTPRSDRVLSAGIILLFCSILGLLYPACRPNPKPVGTPPSTDLITPSSSATGTERLVLGYISSNVNREIRGFQPLIEILHAALEIPVELDIEPSVPAMAEALRRGRVDLYFDSPLPSLQVASSSGAVPSFIWNKHNLESYNSILFTRKDSGILSPDDLPGHSLVLSSRESTSGYGLPKAYLEAMHYHIIQPGQGPFSGGIRVLLSGDTENTMFWILEGKGDVGAVANEYFLDFAGIRREELRVLGQTPSLPRALVCISPKTSPALAGRLRSLLPTLESQYPKKLFKFKETRRFSLLSEKILTRIETILGSRQNTK